MTTETPEPMRDRTRRLAQMELTNVAQELFLERGYEDTTVDQIAAAAGMSRRTFFRYFPSKDDLVIGKYDLFGDRLADAFDARPHDEPVWQSLRRTFDITLEYVQDERQRARSDAMDRIVESSAQLNARYLQKMQRIQEILVGRVADRLALHGLSTAGAQPAAIIGAAFACLQAARSTWLQSEQQRPFSDYLDEAMSVFRVID
ncbi:TetR family transcriptional regulator [Agreia pratensis]|uniref:Transcriptional regulator, TetR family n=1 Tax=Agreia pratensis TaxID=150121 RepID=A0A1X7KS22_9MICO|nr:TetR family transcriptional regulator [Agreia pratensis]SMG43541.1 transcriptional regulator, TetR family [Agreia pratensis]